MSSKQTLAEKYAEHQRNKKSSRNSLRELYYKNKSSTPARRLADVYDRKSISTRKPFPNKANMSNKVNFRMPGYFRTPLKSLKTGNQTTSLPVRSPPTKSIPLGNDVQKYRVHKRSGSYNKNSLFKGNGFLSSIWKMAENIGINKLASSTELSQSRNYATTTAKEGSLCYDTDSKLGMQKNKVVSPLYEDKVDDSITRAKELRSAQFEHGERQLLANTIIEETKKREELQKSFERTSLQMAQKFREEIRLATDTIRDLTTKASFQNQKSPDHDIEEIENRILKQNERFLTQKHKLEAMLREKEDNLIQREAALSMKENHWKSREDERLGRFSIDTALILHSLESIKNDYNSERSAIAEELDLIRTSKKVNSSQGKIILQALSKFVGKKTNFNAYFLEFLLGSGKVSNGGLSIEQGEAFVTEIKDRINRCQEYIADFELQNMKDPMNIGDLFTLEALIKIEKCFETAKDTLYTKLTKAKSKEKEYFKIFLSSDSKSDSQTNVEEMLSAFFSVNHLLSYREQLASLLKDINELRRNLKMLKIRIKKQDMIDESRT